MFLSRDGTANPDSAGSHAAANATNHKKAVVAVEKANKTPPYDLSTISWPSRQIKLTPTPSLVQKKKKSPKKSLSKVMHQSKQLLKLTHGDESFNMEVGH
ncbi:hypothetical protein PCANC_19808 [Puccinia coronata f. sp. avenae]|uniref:Uncharacterized protein n=1 Tax=Puccinia coronata f. sp. avenae TaxID=200324 RepID=A0A2N5UQ71_9BASI|nr:hypothetical protein PCANC_19808 [Puccinia coronata f. sp. avenae]